MHDAKKTHPSDLEIEALFDGELDGLRKREVEAHVASCPECGARLKRIEHLSRGIGVMSERMAEGVDFDAFFAKVNEGIRRAEPTPIGERIGVWLDEFVAFRKAIWIPALAGASAIAVMLAITLSGAPPSPTRLQGGSSNVASVTFDSGSGIVFQMEEENGTTTAVVWVNE